MEKEDERRRSSFVIEINQIEETKNDYLERTCSVFESMTLSKNRHQSIGIFMEIPTVNSLAIDCQEESVKSIKLCFHLNPAHTSRCDTHMHARVVSK